MPARTCGCRWNCTTSITTRIWIASLRRCSPRWDWRIGCAGLASFPAREVVLGTLGVLYDLGDGDDAAGGLAARLHAATWDDTGRPVFTLPVALSIMVFFALCAQCASTLVIIGRETRSWWWPAVTFTYMTVLAWLGAFVVYQVGTALGG